jgi:ArsR family transcriptional regulator
MNPDRVFDALASAARRQMLRHLSQAEMTTTELAARFPMSTPAVSRHLSVLENAGLVASRRDGQRVLYGLVRDTVIEALSGFAAELTMGARAEAGRTKKQREAL